MGQNHAMPVCTLIINVYNMADRLRVVLPSVAVQSFTDFEIVIADDGSMDGTAEVVAAFRASVRQSVRHVWHEDQGFWRTGILNKAFVAARTDYIIVVDGDMLLHPKFVAAHWRYRAPRRALSGYRGVTLRGELSAALLEGREHYSPSLGWLARHGVTGRLGGAVRGVEVHSPLLRRWLGRRSQRLSGCNFSVARALLEQVNGMDSSIREYGYEDFELGHRLGLVGVQVFDVSRRAITYHLEHAKGSVRDVESIKRRIRGSADPVARSGMVELAQGSDAAQLLAIGDEGQ